MAKYTLFTPRIRDTEEETISFPTGRRTRWTATLRLSAVDPAGSIEVALQASPTVDEDLFTEIHNFGPQSTVQTIIARAYGETPDFTVTDRDLFFRAVINSVTGTDWVIELELEAPFFTSEDEDDLDMLPKEFRAHDPAEVARIVQQAEEDVVDTFLSDRHRGVADAWINAPGFLDAVKAEVARQATHIFRREQLARKKDMSSQVTLREMPEYYPGMGKRLQDFIPALGAGSQVWRGRG